MPKPAGAKCVTGGVCCSPSGLRPSRHCAIGSASTPTPENIPFETLRDWECFDADTGKHSAREIREYFIPDFSNWKDHDSFQKAFQRLLNDLKAHGSVVATD
ncbi:hypothetical protein SBA7_1280012 [Candidatus Sulfotelmatobacter sp. SbA7]|nr:hypothetical protein SBA7_1280012 [Candidatus Sulfotelmatobacter sp. SbA7]